MARGMSGGLNVLTLAIYSRLLSPSDYGRYAMAVVIVGLGDAVLFQWLRLGTFRFLPAYEKQPEAFRATIAVGFLGLVGLSGALTLAALIGVRDPVLRQLIWMAVLVLWIQAWFQLNLEWVRCQLLPQRYGYMVCLKSVLVVLFGGAFTWYWQWGPLGPVCGLAVGTLIPAGWQTWSMWRGVRLRLVDWFVCRQLLDYGMPLAANGMLGFVVHSLVD